MNLDHICSVEKEYCKNVAYIHKVIEDEDATDRFVESIQRQFERNWKSVARSALRDGLDKYRGQNSVAQAASIIAAVQAGLERFPDRSISHIEEQIADIYEATVTKFIKRYDLAVSKAEGKGSASSLAVSFSAKDKDAIDAIQNITAQSAGVLFPTSTMEKVSQVVRDVVFNTGLTPAEAGAKLQSEMEGALGLEVTAAIPTTFMSNPAAYFEMLANNAVILSRNIGGIIAMNDAGVTKYRVVAVIDRRTSNICRAMDGRIISTQAGMGMVDKFLSLKSAQEVKDAFSWDQWRDGDVGENTQSNNDSLADKGLGFPPWHGHCYVEGTDVYTRKGFQPFKEVSKGDEFLSLNPETKDLEWVKASAKQEYYYNDNVYHITNDQGSLDLMVTKDHTMFGYRRVDHGKRGRIIEPVFTSPEEFFSSTQTKFYTSSEWQGESPEFIDVGIKLKTEHYCELLAFYLSDGFIHDDRYIYIANARNADYILSRLSLMGFRNVTKSNGKLHIYDSRIKEYFKQFGYAHQKFIPSDLKSLSAEYLDLFLDAYLYCDGHEGKPSVFKGCEFGPKQSYFTSSKRLADDLGEIIIKAGGSCTFQMTAKGKEFNFPNGVYKTNYDSWIINRRTTKMWSKKNVQLVPYEGMVYDVTLEKNHTLLVRFNGKVLWGSNCRSIVIPEF